MTKLAIGALSLTLDQNGCFARAITVAGEEVFRGIGFVARDRNWGTPALVGTVDIAREPDRIVATARGALHHGEAVLAWMTEWTVTASGITARAIFSSPTGFETNRTGFVVLHSLGASRGQDVRVTHASGGAEDQVFPDLVSPHQPFLDIAAMDYVTSAGHHLRLGFEGEVFEIEDQRNWTDASYKTYCRPLARPFPYIVMEETEQRLRLDLLDVAPPAATESAGPVTTKSFTLPPLGTSLPPGPVASGTTEALRHLAPSFTAIEIDLSEAEWAGWARAGIEAAPGALRIDLRPHAAQLAALETLTPALKGRELLGVSLWDADAETVAAARRILAGAPIGGGTGAFFTELNRMTTWPAGADYLTWTSNPTVHGFDDDTIGESIEPLDDILCTALAKIPGQRFQIGPLTLGSRFNPVATRDEDKRRSSDPDPRQGDVITAAWLLGTLAGYADGAVTAIAFFEPIGAKGLLAAGGIPTPAGHLFARLTAFIGHDTRVLVWPAAPRARGLFVEGPDGDVLCAANASATPIRLPLPAGDWTASRLTCAGFDAETPVQDLDLGGFAVTWLTRDQPKAG